MDSPIESPAGVGYDLEVERSILWLGESMQITTLDDLLALQLGRMLSTEQQMDDALGWLIQSAPHPMLDQCVKGYHQQTEERLSRLRDCFRLMGREPRATFCQVAAALIDQARQGMETNLSTHLQPVTLAGHLRQLTAHQIAVSTEACEWGEQLGRAESVLLLQQGLAEHKQMAQTLKDIAHEVTEAASHAA
jgi:Mn-containing catalase